MKKMILIPMLIVLIISGCTLDSKSKKANEDILVYFDKSETWAATYTLIDAGESIFDSLYIQYTGDQFSNLKPIEYILEGDGLKLESQYPQKLVSVSSFQVSGEYNKQLLNNFEDKTHEFKLTIKQDGTTENLNLKLVTNGP